MTTQQRDYYDVLGLDRNASQEDIKRAFRRLAMQYHPDRNREAGAEARFKEINQAYEVLSDPQKRAAYDRFGHAGVGGAFGGAGFEGFNFGGFGDIFDAFFGGAATRQRRGPQRGADLRTTITLDFEEAIFGAEREIEVTRNEVCTACSGLGAEPGSKPERCPSCGGTGEIHRVQQSIFGQFRNISTCERCRGEGKIITNPCSSCRGSGRQRHTRRLVVKMPAGVDHGQPIRLSGEGDAGAGGGSPGSLYVVVNVRPHPHFRRDEDDIIYELAVNVAQATLGTQVTVPTVDGEASLAIPPGTQTDHVFTLRGKGVPRLRGGGRGDQYVRVVVVTPANLTKEQKQLFEQLAQSLGTPSRPPDRDDDRSFFDRIREKFVS
ncbi:MAG: molecular chaperone DnaJ [Dehalococcoidia bacterium]